METQQVISYVVFFIIVAAVVGSAMFLGMYMSKKSEQTFATYIMQDRSSSKNHLGRPDNTLGWPYNDASWNRTLTEG